MTTLRGLISAAKASPSNSEQQELDFQCDMRYFLMAFGACVGVN